MTNTDSESPAESDWPEHWSTGAIETVETVLDVRPDLNGADFGSLMQAGALESQAEALEAVARAAGYVAQGSTGQPVAHPAAVEARHARVAVAAILARLTAETNGPKSNSERARSASRARWANR